MPRKRLRDIAHTLPLELIGEIFTHIHSIEFVYTFSRVCKNWRRIFHELIWRDYEMKTACQQRVDHVGEKCEDLDSFLVSESGRKYVKYLLRRRVYEFSCKLSKIETIPKDQPRWIHFTNQWVDTELAILKGYFQEFSDLSIKPFPHQVPTQTPESTPLKRMFGDALSFIGSLFSKMGENGISKTSISNTNKTECDFLTKVLLDGESRAGKTSFLNASIHDTPVIESNTYAPSIGIEFASRVFKFGKTTSVKVQLWDKYIDREKFRSINSTYYRAASIVLLLLDPYSHNNLELSLDGIKRYAPTAEVVIITTRNDDIQKGNSKTITNEEVDLMAYENFGTFHVDITNTKLEEPKTILHYCALLKYLLTP